MAYISHTPFRPASFDFLVFASFISISLERASFLATKAWGFCYTSNLLFDFRYLYHQLSTTHPTITSPPLFTFTSPSRYNNIPLHQTKLHLPREKQLELWSNLAWRSMVLCFYGLWNGQTGILNWVSYVYTSCFIELQGKYLASVYVFWFLRLQYRAIHPDTNLPII